MARGRLRAERLMRVQVLILESRERLSKYELSDFVTDGHIADRSAEMSVAEWSAVKRAIGKTTNGDAAGD